MNFKRLPDLISSSRFVAALFFRKFLRSNDFEKALLVTILSGFSDGLDGYIARKTGSMSSFGAKLDPVADKAFELTAIAALREKGLIPQIYYLVFFLRNILQLMSFPLLFVIFPRDFKVKPALSAKAATAVCFGVIGMSLFRFRKEPVPYVFFKWLLISVGVVLEIVVLAGYIPRLILIILRKHDTFE